MPVIFEQSKDQTISDSHKDGMEKLLKEYPFEDYQSIANGYWVVGIFNERIVGAMFLESLNNKTCLAHYLAIRKPTQNRGIGKELINRWSKINNKEIMFSDQLKMILGDFK